MKTPFLFAAILSLLSLCCLSISAQERDTRVEYVQSGPKIEVSPELFELISEWALNEDLGDNLIDFLLAKHQSPLEVALFVEAYSGQTLEQIQAQQRFKTSNQSTNCICNTVVPAMSEVSRSTHDTYLHRLLDEDDHFLGNERVYGTLLVDQPAVRMRVETGGDDGAHDGGTEVPAAYVRYDFLNLCTENFERNLECLCDKPLIIEGTYYGRWDYSGSSSCWLCGYGHWSRLNYGFGAYSYDHVPAGNIISGLQISALVDRQIDWSQSTTPGWANLVKAIPSLAQLIFSTTTGPTNDSVNVTTSPSTSTTFSSANSLATALSNLGVQTSSSNPSHQGLESYPFTGNLMLLANIRKTIYYASSTGLAGGGYGALWNTDLWFHSSFHVNHIVPYHDNGYLNTGAVSNPNGCCNEQWGSWTYTENFAEIPSFHENSWAFLNVHGQSQWDYFSTEPSEPNPGYISQGEIVELQAPHGTVYSDYYCTCNGLEDPNGGLFQPFIQSAQSFYCGEDFPMEDLNFPSLPGSISVEWFHDYVPIALGVSGISVSAPGAYLVKYSDPNDPFCSTQDIFFVSDCPEGKFFSDDHISISDVHSFNELRSLMFREENMSNYQLTVTSINGAKLFITEPTDNPKQVLTSIEELLSSIPPQWTLITIRKISTSEIKVFKVLSNMQ